MNLTQPAQNPGDPADALIPGRVLGQYQLVRPLGAGGMGAVFEAVHTGLGKSVAIKTLNPSLLHDGESEARFLREAEAASRLQHPHVVDVTDFGSDRGVIYLVMELLRGEDLGSLLARAPAGLDLEFVADTMLAVCAGVFAAHEMGVIHRDLKPQNIFLQRTPLGAVVPKVLDFGISTRLDASQSSRLTNPGVLMGTTHYVSPEQVLGCGVDQRSDQFALGVILYECLTGRRPHDGDTCFGVMRAICEGRFPPARQLRPDLPAAFETVLLRAMNVRPEYRFASVHALGRALLPFASTRGQVLWGDYFTGVPACESFGTYSSSQAHTSRMRRPVFGGRGRGGRRIFVALCLAAVAGVTVGLLRGRQIAEAPPALPEPPPQIAQRTPDPTPAAILPPVLSDPAPAPAAGPPPAPIIHRSLPPELRKPPVRKARPKAPVPPTIQGRRWNEIAPILE